MKTQIREFTFSVVFGLGVFAFLLAPVADAKSPVTQPFHISAQMTILDGGGGLPYTIFDQGVASILGKFVAVSKMGLDADYNLYDFGIFYGANGDQLFWKSGGSGMAIFTGGTGRFENATGWFTYEMSDPQFYNGPEGTTSVVFTYEGEGSLTH